MDFFPENESEEKWIGGNNYIISEIWVYLAKLINSGKAALQKCFFRGFLGKPLSNIQNGSWPYRISFL